MHRVAEMNITSLTATRLRRSHVQVIDIRLLNEKHSKEKWNDGIRSSIVSYAYSQTPGQNVYFCFLTERLNS